MNWGKSIVLVFILFAGFIATLVTVCIRQDVSLVSRDYYKEELNYGQQIERMQNTNQLASKPVIAVSGKLMTVTYNELHAITAGDVKLFRPSNAMFDRTFQLTTAGTQSFNLDNLPQGMYKVRMNWTAAGKEYFLEQIINL